MHKRNIRVEAEVVGEGRKRGVRLPGMKQPLMFDEQLGHQGMLVGIAQQADPQIARGVQPHQQRGQAYPENNERWQIKRGPTRALLSCRPECKRGPRYATQRHISPGCCCAPG